MTEYVECLLNGRFPLIVPDFRKTFWDARPTWEIGRMESCFDLMNPGMIVYDVGSEHGDMSSAYRKWVGDDGDVIPIEPAAHYWEFIKGTWEANGFSRSPELTFVGLIGDTSNTDVPFTGGWPLETDTVGVPDGGFVHLAQGKGHARRTIDDVALVLIPDAIVLDIEGAEFHALAGAIHTLAEHRPLVWVSMHDIGDGAGWNGPLKDWYHKTPDDIHNLMKDFGYSVEELPYNGEGEHFFLYRPQ